MFDSYSRSFKVKILNFMEFMDINKGEMLFSEGKEVESIYFLVSGTFETYKPLILTQQKGVSTIVSSKLVKNINLIIFR